MASKAVKRRPIKGTHSTERAIKFLNAHDGPQSSSALSPRKPTPYAFVIDALEALSPWTRNMFGCTAVYIGEKIVLCLRDKAASPIDNGVWLATTCDHHESLRRDFPNMRSIAVLGKEVTGWQLLPADAPDFEESAVRACELITQRDTRIGKVPVSKRRKQSTRAKSRARSD